VSAAPGAGGVVIPPNPPRNESDPVREVIDAWDWARDFFNRRAGEYAVVLEDLPSALARALG
jgi:hypothetical protein